MNRTERIVELEQLISKMDIPFYRKSIKSKDSIRWLNRNIAVCNSKHPAYPEAVKLIKELL